MSERNYDETGDHLTGDFIYLNIDGQKGEMYRNTQTGRRVIPRFTGYIDSCELIEDQGNAQFDILPGPAYILIISAKDSFDNEVKQFRLKVRSDYAFAAPRFVNVLAGQCVKGEDNLITVGFYKKEDSRSLFCSIYVNKNRDGKLEWVSGSGYPGAPRLDTDREGFIKFWTDIWKNDVMPAINGKPYEPGQPSDTDEPREIYSKVKQFTINSLATYTDANTLVKKFSVAVKRYVEKGLTNTEKELLRQLWIEKLRSFPGYGDWSLNMDGSAKEPEVST